ncbi:MAG: hypothetical protein WCR56_02030 [Bacilli bacterium]
MTAGSTGSITIHSYAFYENGDDAYDTKWRPEGTTVVEDATSSKITFTDVPDAWWGENAQHGVEGSKLASNTTKIVFTFKGPKDIEFLFKAQGFGSTEGSIVATGEKQTFEVELGDLAGDHLADLYLLVVFCKTPKFTGTLEIFSIEYK